MFQKGATVFPSLFTWINEKIARRCEKGNSKTKCKNQFLQILFLNMGQNLMRGKTTLEQFKKETWFETEHRFLLQVKDTNHSPPMANMFLPIQRYQRPSLGISRRTSKKCLICRRHGVLYDRSFAARETY